jgi:putative tryptophan/tyrosine transport system substrate-binding protein
VLELFKEAVPNISRIALLVDHTDPYPQRTIKANQAAADALGLSLSPAEIATPNDIEPVFAKIAEERADGVVYGTGSMLFNLRSRIGASITTHRLPALAYNAQEVPCGVLLSYGQDFFSITSAASYVDKILKGAKPADLSVEQPTKFKLVLNLKMAKVLGITFPQTLLLSADEMIGA